MSEYWDERAQTLEGAQRAAWDEDEPDRHCARMIGRLVPLRGPQVEIGCGPGRLLDEDTIGVDSSPNMVRWAIKSGACAVVNDGYHLPFPDESVTGVYSVLVFQHVPDQVVESYGTEAHRILKPGGVFVAQYVTMGDIGPNNHPRSLTDMTALISQRPWTSLLHIDDPKYPEWAWIRCTK